MLNDTWGLVTVSFHMSSFERVVYDPRLPLRPPCQSGAFSWTLAV